MTARRALLACILLLWVATGCAHGSVAEPGSQPDAGGGASGHDAGHTGSSGATSSGGTASAGRSGNNAGASGRPGSGGVQGSSGASAGRASAAGNGGKTAGTGASGNTGTAGMNSGEFFGDSRCAAGLLVCDGFEDTALNTTLWKAKGSLPELDSTRAARGKKSLHSRTTATSFRGIETTKIFPAMNNSYFGRLFVWFDALPTSPQWAHWTIAGANGPSGGGEIRVGGQYDGKINRFGVGTDGGPTGDWTNLDDSPAGGKDVPLGRWLCVEWQHKGDTNETHFWLDGVENTSLATTRDVKHQGNASVKYDLPQFSSVWIGFWNYDQGKPVTPNQFDVWIDEVALDDERIGCTL